MIKSGAISELSMDIKDNFKPEIFLDSGSGNILKDLGFEKIAHFTKDKLTIEKDFKKISKNIIDFSNKLKIENLVLIDYAGKNTYKKKKTQ